jgi:hypothetical protein
MVNIGQISTEIVPQKCTPLAAVPKPFLLSVLRSISRLIFRDSDSEFNARPLSFFHFGTPILDRFWTGFILHFEVAIDGSSVTCDRVFEVASDLKKQASTLNC